MSKYVIHAASMAAASLAWILAAPALAADAVNVVDGLALRGFDPVAFFIQKQPVMGSPQFTAVHEGATYEFANADDKAAFEADPAKYLPQYGGFCAAATSHGRKVDADPRQFTINHGKLYVNYNHEANEAFQKDVEASIKAADEKWPEVKTVEDVIR